MFGVDWDLSSVGALALGQGEPPENSSTGNQEFRLSNFDTGAHAETTAKLVVSHEFGEFGEGFFVRRERWVEPSLWSIRFGVWVGNRIAGDGQFDGVDDSALRDEVALVDIIFLEKTGDACCLLAFIERLGGLDGTYPEGLGAATEHTLGSRRGELGDMERL